MWSGVAVSDTDAVWAGPILTVWFRKLQCVCRRVLLPRERVHDADAATVGVWCGIRVSCRVNQPVGGAVRVGVLLSRWQRERDGDSV